MSTQQRTTAWYIFKKKYLYSLEYSFFMGVDRLNVNGVITDGTPEDFERTMASLQATNGTIMEIAEFYHQGAEVDIPPENIVEIYQRIENHLADFEHRLRFDVNMEFATLPMDDFKILDSLAEKLFPYARAYSKRLPKPVEARRISFHERMGARPIKTAEETPLSRAKRTPEQTSGTSRLYDLIQQHQERRDGRNY